MFTAVSLISWYLMPHLRFWNTLFVETPYLMLGVGIYTLVVSFYGFFVSTSGNRGLLIAFAVLLSIACISQIVSIFRFWTVKDIIDEYQDGVARGKKDLKKYWENDHEDGYDVTASWDKMQRHLHCCGVKDFMDWVNANTDDNGNNDVPDSCCIREDTSCGEGKLGKSTRQSLYEDIYMDGCFRILHDWMTSDIVPLIDVYSGVGTITAIIELIAIALVSAYCAQIKRKRAREEKIQMDNRFPTSPGFNSRGQILLETEHNPSPEYESSRHESEI